MLGILLGAAVPAHAGVTPNDPYWPAEWAQRQVRAQELWSFTTGSPGVVVAVVDTGVRSDLADLPPDALVPGWDFVDHDGVLRDTHGHGSFVATEIAGRGNNGVGTAGYCWACRIMPVRVAGSSGVPAQNAVASGIMWAVQHGARIVNISFNSKDRDDVLEYAVAYARAAGAYVVASAGNSSDTSLTYPASYPGVFAVAATTETDVLYPWSTRGPWVKLGAPGCQVATTPGETPQGENWFGVLCGTSVTAPAVSGIIGLLLSLRPSLTPEEVASALSASAVAVPGIAGGRVDAYGAAAALGLVPPTPPPDRAPVPVQNPSQNPASGPRVSRSSPAQTAKKHRRTITYSSQARIMLGTVRTRRDFVLNLGKGKVKIIFNSPAASDCTLTLNSRNRILLAAQTEHDEILLSTVVAKGRYALDLHCRSSRPKRFTLQMTAMFPR
jgi:subtilisin family serine protease